MELTITLGFGGWAILIAGSLIFGGIAQFVGETRGLPLEPQVLGGASLRVEGPEVGAVRLVGPRHGVARLPAGGRELLAGEVDGDSRVRERVDGMAF